MCQKVVNCRKFSFAFGDEISHKLPRDLVKIAVILQSFYLNFLEIPAPCVRVGRQMWGNVGGVRWEVCAAKNNKGHGC